MLGDLNINMSCATDSKFLKNVLETNGLINMIQDKTCFKSETGSLIDVILTSNPKRVSSTLNTNIGISDFHNLVGFATRIHVPKAASNYVTYRSYKTFDENNFKFDISTAPYHVADIFDDYDDNFWFQHCLISDIIETHAPLKRKKLRKRPVPFMNSALRKACHQKAMAQNRYFKKGRTNKLWQEYKQRRNYCTKMRTISMKKYFDERCNGVHNKNGAKFWETIKPFITDKAKTENSCITLKIGDDIVNDPVKVSNHFNDFFCNVASKLGFSDSLQENDEIHEIIKSYEDHDSIKTIRSKYPDPPTFSFNSVSPADIGKILRNIDSNKATGYDNVPPKLIKVAANELAHPISNLINKSINASCFPSQLKRAEVSPLYKGQDNLTEGNYRPVSVLVSLSKVFELVFHDQLSAFFENVLSSLLAAFRKRYSTQHVLIKLVEDCKAALDRKEHVGIIQTDLSKAFDCLSHRLILCKLHAYGVSTGACDLIRSYLCDRMQRVKLGHHCSVWGSLNKGVPQGSVLGPLLFNIYTNDMVYVLEKECMLSNYADDNSLRYSSKSLSEVTDRLERCSNIAMSWFSDNGMSANPSKFQVMLMECTSVDVPPDFKIADYNVPICNEIKVLGVYINERVNFESHISMLCARTSRQINALARIAKYIDVQGRINIYNAFITSNFSYCSIVWHFCHSDSTLKIEKLNKRALRVVFNDYTASYPDLLRKIKRPPLYIQRLQLMVIEVYKCINGTNPDFMGDLFSRHVKSHNTRSTEPLIQPRAATITYGIKSLKYQGAKLWNALPNNMKCASSLENFKLLIREWDGPHCSCGYCLQCKVWHI